MKLINISLLSEIAQVEFADIVVHVSNPDLNEMRIILADLET